MWICAVQDADFISVFKKKCIYLLRTLNPVMFKQTKKKRKRNTEETKSVSLTKLLINTSLCVYDSHFLRWSGQVRP